MADLPESLQRAREAALAAGVFAEPFKVDDKESSELQALRASQYSAAQLFLIRRALEDMAVALHSKQS